MNAMDIVNLEEENQEFQKEYLQKEELECKDSNSKENVEDDEKFIRENTYAELGISPWYIGKFLKDTVRNDGKVGIDYFHYVYNSNNKALPLWS